MRSIDDIQQIFSIDVQPTLLCGYQKKNLQCRHVLYHFLWSRNLAQQLKSVVFFRYLLRISLPIPGDACAKFLPSMEPRVHLWTNGRVVTLKLQPWKLTAGTQNYPIWKGKSSEPNLNCWVQNVHFPGYNKVTRCMCQLWVYPEKVTENSGSFCHSKTPNKKRLTSFFHIPTISLTSTTKNINKLQESNKNTLNNSNLSDWNHPTDSPKLTSAKMSLLRLTNLSTVAGLGIHCPCFQAKERCEMYLRGNRQVDSWKLWQFESEFSMAKSCGFFLNIVFWYFACWLGLDKRGMFLWCFFAKVEIYVQTQLVVTSLHLLHVILLRVSNTLFTFVEN